jgi:hypothetical protein
VRLFKLTGKGFHARLSRAAMFLWICTGVVYKWLNSSIYGLLAVSLLLYLVIVPCFTDVVPMPLREAISVLAAQGIETILTVLGVVAAYATISSWRSQKQAELRLVAAGEIETFFHSFLDEARKVELYFSDVLELRTKIDHKLPWAEIEFDARWAHEHTGNVPAAVALMRKMSVDVHQLQSRHSLVLKTSAMAPFAFNRAAQCLNRIANALPWVPSASDTAHFANLVGRADISQWQHYVAVFHREYLSMFAEFGKVKGAFSVDVLRPSLFSILQVRKEMSILSDIENEV